MQCAIVCCKSNARKVPLNYILLFVFTACEAFFFSYAASLYDANSSIMAGGMTAGMTVALFLYAVFTKTDFTVCGSLFFVLFVSFILVAIFSIFMATVSWW